jgi:prefoldin subunit 5
MDWGNAAQLASAAVAITALSISIVTAMRADLKKVLKDIDQDVDLLKDRMHTVEEHIRHLPAADTTHRLEKSIVELQGQLAVVSERLRPVAAISDRLQDFLIEQSRHPR